MSENGEKPEKIARPGTFCHSCGERGHVFEIPETVQISQGDIDLPLFRCENCGFVFPASYGPGCRLPFPRCGYKPGRE